ncbi:M23 family metallopeptidase [Rubrivirga sp. S365]|uniref:M23 family metallopeptidase n=1 Tax=Rubrivirga litoralis TaxID=3075598 RepID=A0ABU3BSN2_9BACT|nr:MULTISPECIES: M23 family metallopeptidase [unclassified Rubrivirga]MDT0632310.1 M23 family metallopeptidase [Rubrivirga sp. F394]MDT7856305.1 M23 family metallopeptidase [Rubrivirga sp. S365]
MSSNRYYYYDHDAGAFVAVEAGRRAGRRAGWAKVGAAAALVLGVVGMGVASEASTGAAAAPAETTQAEEISVLRGELAAANARLTSFAARVDVLAETDRELYRTVLEADPVPAGGAVGETEPENAAPVVPVRRVRDDAFARFSEPTADLLEETTEAFDRLERQLALQSESYDELRSLAARRDAVLRQQPAILPLKNARLTSGFGMRRHPILRVSRLHAGVDFAAPVGTPLYAAGDGRVSFVGTRGGYGTVVEIEHPLAGKLTRYAHLSRAADGVREGARVRRGQTVAYSGDSGLSTSPHLHYEVRQLDAARTPLNPVTTFVPDVAPAEYRQILAAARAPTASFD